MRGLGGIYRQMVGGGVFFPLRIGLLRVAWILVSVLPQLSSGLGLAIVSSITRQRLPNLPRREIFPEGTVISEAPPFSKVVPLGGQSATAPSIELVTVSAAVVVPNRRFPSVVSERYMIVPPRRFDAVVKLHPGPRAKVHGGILFQRGDSVLFKSNPKMSRTLDAAIFFGAVSPDNWFHWLIDSLPSLHMANLSRGIPLHVPILVPHEIREKPDWRTVLESFSQGRPLIWVSGHETVRVGQLYWADSPTDRGPYALDGRPWPLAIHAEAFQSYREELVASLIGARQTRPFRKIFLARKETARRRYNQHQSLEIARSYGYVPLFLEDLPISESARLFHEASHVVGPHGAGWANLIFCQPDVRAVLATWPTQDGFSYFSNLAKAVGANLSFIQTKGHAPVPRGGQPAHFLIDPLALRESIEGLET